MSGWGLHQMLRSVGGRLMGRGDEWRWTDLAHHEPEWDERAALIARMIPRGSRVLEFGAGRCTLARHLDPSCSYTPSDLVSRGPDTFVCDLNRRPLPDLAPLRTDVVVFAGVLEYLWRVREIPPWLARNRVAVCVASYECARTARGRSGRLRERWARARLGWVSTFTEEELRGLFARAGFAGERTVVWHTPDGDEPIMTFRRAQEDMR